MQPFVHLARRGVVAVVGQLPTHAVEEYVIAGRGRDGCR
jgi:hypothetical protein